ncbi:hypothetical protein SAMN05443999_1098 [Roseovarius azorensis]|uniref:YfbU domain-containing protein n=1 Tax=Roseovarius azorensis TaxID=1287727 RepID=A0A1H7TPR7_9RHOB|nr:YfbU family protein [Roseovarius azorensis]SEL86862.1 hypothetical protein SAMN05443999_1098 [Roseovarius azorensis]
MKLTDGEKIIIAMLADVHKALKIEGETDVKHLMESIYSGNLWSLDWDWQGLLGAKETPDHVVKETADILDMWSLLETAYERLEEADKDKVKAANHGHGPVFSGFDGNNDDHFGVAKHFIEVMDRFAHFEGRDLNSHSQMSLPRYRQMYPKFEELRAKLADRDLTADEIISVLQAEAA